MKLGPRLICSYSKPTSKLHIVLWVSKRVKIIDVWLVGGGGAMKVIAVALFYVMVYYKMYSCIVL